MKTWLFFVHLGVTCLFVGAILGIGLGIINPSVTEYSKYMQTTCYNLGHSNKTYDYCYQSCNTSIPACDVILTQNISGQCYNDTNEELIKYTQCYIVCDIYTILNFTIRYTANDETYIQNVEVDCKNNQTCINNLFTDITCFYNKENPVNVVIVPPTNYRWEYLAAIVILLFLMLFYITINLTVFKKYNYFCGKEW